MTMKKIIFYTLFTFLSVFSSCSSFLDEKPTDRLVVDNFYSSAKDAQAAVDAGYSQLNALYNRLMYMLGDLPTDDMKNGLGMPNAFLQNLEFLRIDPQNTFVKDMWVNCYSGISRTNSAIENIPKITMDETLRNRLIGEAKFLRALYYFNLVRFFGDVPLFELHLRPATGRVRDAAGRVRVREQLRSAADRHPALIRDQGPEVRPLLQHAF